MAIANPRIHMICGICGCNKEFSYRIVEDDVLISCGNCASLTALDEIIKQRDNEKK